MFDLGLTSCHTLCIGGPIANKDKKKKKNKKKQQQKNTHTKKNTVLSYFKPAKETYDSAASLPLHVLCCQLRNKATLHSYAKYLSFKKGIQGQSHLIFFFFFWQFFIRFLKKFMYLAYFLQPVGQNTLKLWRLAALGFHGTCMHFQYNTLLRNLLSFTLARKTVIVPH